MSKLEKLQLLFNEKEDPDDKIWDLSPIDEKDLDTEIITKHLIDNYKDSNYKYAQIVCAKNCKCGQKSNWIINKKILYKIFREIYNLTITIDDSNGHFSKCDCKHINVTIIKIKNKYKN